ncbi:hypothetical protein [Streptomyces bambusae]|uniref:PE-PGRS family protein n=1 Tax=Streptomyces bambusae TaxID=1550616 RepID=A0ABS6ZBB2_9ACTN|nr:hypothetical protein [Streptomyces bambusae]MBW5485062.1 hypothetical protein [Streptomyces bambusae]
MKPISRTARITAGDFARPDGARHPFHPRSYEIVDPAEIREVLAALPDRPPAADGFECMCVETTAAVTLYDAGGQKIRSLRAHDRAWHDEAGRDGPELPPVRRLLDPLDPAGLPARHRARWVAEAPEGLRAYAAALAAGTEPGPETARGVPLGRVFRWLGGVRDRPADAARLLAELAPERLLAGRPTEELAWAVRETDRVGLEGAVRFFAGEHFTTRHPKRRRVPETARNLLLRHARSHRPGDLAVLERRLLRAPEDRVRRS